MRCFLIFSFLVSLLVCVSLEESVKGPLRSTNIDQVVSHPQIVPLKLPTGSQPILLHLHRPNQQQSVNSTPYKVKKVRTNLPNVRQVHPLRQLYGENLAYIKLVNFDKTPESKADGSSPDEIINLYFDFIKNNDQDYCLLRLICQIGFNRTVFGNFGDQVSGFFSELPSGHGAVVEYLEAFNTREKHSDEKVCMQKYPTCHYDSRDLMKVGNDLMSKNLTNLQLDEVQKDVRERTYLLDEGFKLE